MEFPCLVSSKVPTQLPTIGCDDRFYSINSSYIIMDCDNHYSQAWHGCNVADLIINHLLFIFFSNLCIIWHKLLLLTLHFTMNCLVSLVSFFFSFILHCFSVKTEIYYMLNSYDRFLFFLFRIYFEPSANPLITAVQST